MRGAHNALNTPFLGTVGPKSGDDIATRFATRFVSSNGGAHCAAGTTNIGRYTSSHRIGNGCVHSSRH